MTAPDKVIHDPTGRTSAVARILLGDCIDRLKDLPEESVHTCITSPPYFGLRSYLPDDHPDKAKEIGLEQTPDEFVAAMVAVFREVRRALRDDGTLWLNLGDSYAGGGGGNYNKTGKTQAGGQHVTNVRNRPDWLEAAGVKAKDIIGIPWRVAFALQQPYYTGKVPDERDRVWLAAMVDAEGSICGTEYQSNDRTKTNIYISVTNTSVPVIDKCERLFPQEAKHVYEKSGPSSRICYRWDVERMETKALFLREIYPHLVAKRKQAIVGYTFIELQHSLVSKKKGYLPEQQEQRSWLMAALSRLNAGEDVDLPDWVIEPPSLFEPGFYLRQDLIWHKPNPMPESVTDRCTKAHEYLFLLSKSPRYYFDHESIQEPAIGGMAGNTKPTKAGRAYQSGAEEHRTAAGLHLWAERQRSRRNSFARATKTTDGLHGQKPQFRPDREPVDYGGETRNKRSVWTIATKPYSGAHFAVFPPDLIEPCVLAGCPEGGTVLDPFGGSGTTAGVALKHGRSAIVCELNAESIALIPDRVVDICRPEDAPARVVNEAQVELFGSEVAP